MSDVILPAYANWARYNQRLREAVAPLTVEQLSLQPAPDRWPLWATIGHLACQRVSALCGLAGEPGADTTPFPNALYECPGDEDLDHPLDAAALVASIDSTFHIIERCLTTWTLAMLSEEIRHTFDDGEWARTRGAILHGAAAHDMYHCAELNESFGRLGLPQIDLWS